MTSARCTALNEDPEGKGPPFRCVLPAGHEGYHEGELEMYRPAEKDDEPDPK